jgi:prepilin peptidase CpaA
MTLHTPDFVYLFCAALCASMGAVYDVRTRRIPNILTGFSTIFGLLLHLGFGGWKAMGIAAIAGLGGGTIFLIFFVAGGMGAGDVKLMAAVSCIAGFGHLPEFFLATVLAGGVFAVGLAMARGRLKSTLMNVGTLVAHHGANGLLPHPELNVQHAGTLRLPYGLAIAAGSWFALASLVLVR